MRFEKETDCQRRLALLVEYQGSNYHGFQVQPGKITIQGEIEKALARLLGEHIKTQGAGRTDAGVHANGQVISFCTIATYSPEAFANALNAILPRDIRIVAGFAVRLGFNVRKEATSRQYRYLILNRFHPSAIWREFAYQFQTPLDYMAMNRVAELLEGSYAEAPFVTSKGFKTCKTNQVIIKANVTKQGQLIMFNVEANKFYFRQIRRTAGALIQVGKGQISEESFIGMAKGMIGTSTIHGLPPHGLYLSRVSYGTTSLERYLGESKGLTL